MPPPPAAGSTQTPAIPTLALSPVAGVGSPGQWLAKDYNVPPAAANDYYIVNVISLTDNSLILGPLPLGPIYNEPGQAVSGSWVEYFHH